MKLKNKYPYATQKLGPYQLAWVKSLEEEDLRQTQYQLFKYDAKENPENPYSYCCLGVACEVARVNGVRIKFDKDKECISVFGNKEMWSGLPDEMVKLMSFHDAYGHFENRLKSRSKKALAKFMMLSRGAVSLSQMNDTGMSFEEIALFVRNFPQCVFSEPK